MIRIFFDGSYRPKNNRNRIRWGFVAYDLNDEIVHHAAGKQAHGRSDSTLAEVYGFRHAWHWALENHANHKVEFFSDSKALIDVLRAEAPRAGRLYRLICDQRINIPKYWSFNWVPREENKVADLLSKGMGLR